MSQGAQIVGEILDRREVYYVGGKAWRLERESLWTNEQAFREVYSIIHDGKLPKRHTYWTELNGVRIGYGPKFGNWLNARKRGA